jgi:hypothetical protein
MARCMQCGGMSKATKMKKMQKGGMKTTVGSKDAKTFIAGMPNSGPTGPNYQGIDTMQKGGAKKMAKGGSSFGMLSVKAGIDKNPNPTAADRIAGAKMSSPKKAKFGASVKVQRSPKAGKVRSASDQGYAAVGKREPGRIIKKTITKKK